MFHGEMQGIDVSDGNFDCFRFRAHCASFTSAIDLLLTQSFVANGNELVKVRVKHQRLAYGCWCLGLNTMWPHCIRERILSMKKTPRKAAMGAENTNNQNQT